MTTTQDIEQLVNKSPDRDRTGHSRENSFDSRDMTECMEICTREIIRNLIPGYTLWRTSQNKAGSWKERGGRLALATGVEFIKAVSYGVAGYFAYYLTQ
ncbi:MAG TPA: hypothetical protein VJK07_04345 [Candidatus Nanoarchaeia archaeon]|nr:hypothetical protein [Candidatus Nanoarchaeia archaeon]